MEYAHNLTKPAILNAGRMVLSNLRIRHIQQMCHMESFHSQIKEKHLGTLLSSDINLTLLLRRSLSKGNLLIKLGKPGPLSAVFTNH